jgi:dTDP-4-dehydrorhamnose 3,5-epimerase
MQVEQLRSASGALIEGPLLITPQVFGDDRGFFFESWNQRRFDEAVGQPITFSQDNHSRSSRGVLRGLHYQLEPEPQGKLVRCPSARSSMWRWICAAARPRLASGWERS